MLQLNKLFKNNTLYIQGDQKVSVHLTNNPHTTDDLKMAITEYIRNVDRAILSIVFENTVRRVNKCLETGGGHFEQYLLISIL
jgi:hypothetical protein